MSKKPKAVPANPDTITVTLGQLIACGLPIAQGAPTALLSLSRARMPGRLSYQLGRLIRDIDGELKAYEPVRMELFRKHGTVSDDGTVINLLTDESRSVFNAEHAEVIATEITLNHKKMPELLEFAELTASEAMALEWLIG